MDLFQRFLDDPAWPAADKPPPWKPDRAISPTGACPAHMLNWVDAIKFCNWLSHREGRRPCYQRTGGKWKAKVEGQVGGKDTEIEAWRCDFDADGYCLPTEAEWEYACRAGTRTWWYPGDGEEGPEPLPYFAAFHRLRAAPCASKIPNNWGLFDMHGNVREWCWDWYHRYTGEPETDPTGPLETPRATDRVHRGGSWYDEPAACRSSFRNRSPLLLRDRVVGLRVACGHPARGAGNPKSQIPNSKP